MVIRLAFAAVLHRLRLRIVIERDIFEPSPPPWFSSRGLGIVALVLFTLYLTIVIDAALPVQLLDPTWQIRLTGALLNAAGFPLVGLALLHLAADLHPDDPRLAGRRHFYARLAVPVAVGFLLLIPLQGHASWRQRSATATAQTTRLQQATERLQQLRRAVDQSSTPGELRQRLSALQAPNLSPADLEKPLPEIKRQLGALITRAEQQIKPQESAPPSPQILPLLQQLIRNSIACLALAIGFAALGRRRRAELSFLEEWRYLGERLTSRPEAGPKRGLPDADYVNIISDSDETGRQPPR